MRGLGMVFWCFFFLFFLINYFLVYLKDTLRLEGIEMKRQCYIEIYQIIAFIKKLTFDNFMLTFKTSQPIKQPDTLTLRSPRLTWLLIGQAMEGDQYNDVKN